MSGVRTGDEPRLAVDGRDAGDSGGDPEAPGPGGAPPPEEMPPERAGTRITGLTVHRLRDLPRPGLASALAVAVALVAAPLAAFVLFTPDWSATNDPALMGLRALDVGTGNTPMIGQPSQSRIYDGSAASVHHPGPLHFYLLAGPLRLLGPSWGMPAVSVLITGTCLLVAAWVAYRLLGARAALVAAAALALVAFTTGTASLVNPVSSSIAGYPLLLSAVTLCAVAAGDVRLLPLATAAVTFTAQQHLSVLPATAVLCAGAFLIGALLWRRSGRGQDPAQRRDLRRSAGWSAGLACVLWLPVLAQQVVGDAGNLGEMLSFARHGNSETLGYGRSLQQVAHALGLPPLLGRTDLHGTHLLTSPSVLTWLSAAATLGLVGLTTWRRRTDPARLALGGMTGVAVVAGLVGGASVPVGQEQGRLTFYHWAFVVAVFVVLVVGTAMADAVAALVASRRRTGVARVARPAVAAVTVVAVAALGIVSPALDRPHNTPMAAYSSIPAADLGRLADDLLAHRDELGDHTLLVSRGEEMFSGIDAGLVLEAAHRGLDLRVPLSWRFFVNDDRLVDRDELDGGLVLVASGVETPARVPEGRLISRVEFAEPFPFDALDRLLAAAADADEVVYDRGPLLEIDDPARRALFGLALDAVTTDADRVLLNRTALDLIARSSFTSPVFDPDDVRAVRVALEVLDTDGVAGRVTELRLYLLDRDQLLDYVVGSEVGGAAPSGSVRSQIST
jgi:hypothetical protein